MGRAWERECDESASAKGHGNQWQLALSLPRMGTRPRTGRSTAVSFSRSWWRTRPARGMFGNAPLFHIFALGQSFTWFCEDASTHSKVDGAIVFVCVSNICIG